MELQEFKAAARCIAEGFCTMHSRHSDYRDVWAANACWQNNSRQSEAVVVDPSSGMGPLDTCPPIQLQKLDALGIEHPEHGPLMSHARAYTQYCDMHLMGFMLSEVSKELPWGSNSKDICQVLQSKQLTAS